MSLINSLAVIALITDHFYRTRWVPYEFEGVKYSGWFATGVGTYLLDYLVLAPQINYDNGQYHDLHDGLGTRVVATKFQCRISPAMNRQCICASWLT